MPAFFLLLGRGSDLLLQLQHQSHSVTFFIHVLWSSQLGGRGTERVDWRGTDKGSKEPFILRMAHSALQTTQITSIFGYILLHLPGSSGVMSSTEGWVQVVPQSSPKSSTIKQVKEQRKASPEQPSLLRGLFTDPLTEAMMYTKISS